MDNFSAHNAAVEALNSLPKTALKNTRIVFLPPNVTSRYQPLDQGIIAAWKAHYKRKWLRFLMFEADHGRDALKKMDVLQAMRWGIQAWHNDVTEAAICNCWAKSGLLGKWHYGRNL